MRPTLPKKAVTFIVEEGETGTVGGAVAAPKWSPGGRR
jgi:hypothetical protein